MKPDAHRGTFVFLAILGVGIMIGASRASETAGGSIPAGASNPAGRSIPAGHPVTEPDPSALQLRGAALAGELGCGGCHAGAPSPTAALARTPAFGSANPPLEPAVVFDYLADPTRRRDGLGATRMPDFRLDEGERVALARFLASPRGAGGSPGGAGGSPGGAGAPGAAAPAGTNRVWAAARDRHPDADAQRGRKIFGVLGCVGCHDHPEAADPETPPPGNPSGAPGRNGAPPAQVGPDLSREGARVRPEWLRAWIVDPVPVRGPAHPNAPGARMPDFGLSDEEADALTAWLGTLGARSPTRPAASQAASPAASQAASPAATSRSTRDRALPAPVSPLVNERIDRMLTNRIACRGCHTLGGRGGRIGPSLDGAAERLRPAFVAMMIRDPASAAPGSPMPHQPVPEADVARLAAVVLASKAPRAQPSWPSLADATHPAWTSLGEGAPGGVEPASALYARQCAACHGSGGRGDGWNARNLPVPPTNHTDAELLGRRPDDTLFDAVHGGAWVLDGSPLMPSFGGFLDAQQIAGLVEYLRTLCGCAQPSWAGTAR